MAITNIKLTLPTIERILTHSITQWDDPEILGENPDIPLLQFPAVPQIAVVVRRDSSSTTTALVSAFLADPGAKTNWQAYARAVGQDPNATPDTWPADPSAATTGVTSGSSGVIYNVMSLDPATGNPNGLPVHSLGYVAPEWAIQYHAPIVAVRNNATPAVYMTPTPAAVANAFSSPGVAFHADTHLYSIDYSQITATGSYPIPLPSYEIVATAGGAAAKATPLANFIRFSLGTAGQADVTGTGMVPVPANVATAGLTVATALDAVAAAASTTTTASTSTSTSTTTTTASPWPAVRVVGGGASTSAAGGGSSGTGSGGNTTPAGGSPVNGSPGPAAADPGAAAHIASPLAPAAAPASAALGSSALASMRSVGPSTLGSGLDPAAVSSPLTGPPSVWVIALGLTLVGVGELGRRRATRDVA